MKNLEKFQVANKMLDTINGGGLEAMVRMSFSGINAAEEAEKASGASCACSCGCSGGGAGGGAGSSTAPQNQSQSGVAY